MMSERENMQMAKDILLQLGGKEFVRMTGTKDFLRMDDGLRMDLAPNMSRANRLLVTLKESDEYEMYFYRITFKRSWEHVISHETRLFPVYAEDLARHFREVTGLETRMPKVFRRD